MEGTAAALKITPYGRTFAGDVVPLPRPGPELLEHWAAKFGPTEAAILRKLAEGTRPQSDLASETGYSPTSGGFKGALAKLRKLDLISGGSTGLRISDDLMGGA
jgi:hypothetical protein